MTKTILLVHGWGASTKKLKPLADELAKLGWKVKLVRLPGFDLADPKAPWNLLKYANHVLSKAGKEKFFLFGHSFGGRIATKIALTNPSRLKGLILCAPGGFYRPSSIKRYIFCYLAKKGKLVLGKTPLRGFTKKLLYKLAREHDYEKTRGIMKKIFQNVVEEDLEKVAGRIKIPTLVLWGDKDTMLPVKGASVVGNIINNSKVIVYKNQGHTLPYDMPALLARDINKWIKR